jgi:hypothetical protein
MEKKPSKRQQNVYDLLVEMSANNAIKITNGRLAEELSRRKGMFGYDNKPLGDAAVSRFLSELNKRGKVRVEQGHTTRDRIIYILKS